MAPRVTPRRIFPIKSSAGRRGRGSRVWNVCVLYFAKTPTRAVRADDEAGPSEESQLALVAHAPPRRVFPVEQGQKLRPPVLPHAPP